MILSSLVVDKLKVQNMSSLMVARLRISNLGKLVVGKQETNVSLQPTTSSLPLPQISLKILYDDDN